MTTVPAKSWGRRAAVAVAVAFALRLALGLWFNLDGRIHRGFPFYGHMARHLVDGDGMYWSF